MIFALLYFAIACAYIEAIHWQHLHECATRRELTIVACYLSLSLAYVTATLETLPRVDGPAPIVTEELIQIA